MIVNLTRRWLLVAGRLLPPSGDAPKIALSIRAVDDVDGKVVSAVDVLSLSGLPAPALTCYYVVDAPVVDAALRVGRSTRDLLVALTPGDDPELVARGPAPSSDPEDDPTEAVLVRGWCRDLASCGRADLLDRLVACAARREAEGAGASVTGARRARPPGASRDVASAALSVAELLVVAASGGSRDPDDALRAASRAFGRVVDRIWQTLRADRIGSEIRRVAAVRSWWRETSEAMSSIDADTADRLSSQLDLALSGGDAATCAPLEASPATLPEPCPVGGGR